MRLKGDRSPGREHNESLDNQMQPMPSGEGCFNAGQVEKERIKLKDNFPKVGIIQLDANWMDWSPDWVDYTKKPVKIQAVKMDMPFRVITREGTMKGKKGDFLIKGIKGEFYPCDAEIFRKTYKKV